MISKDTEAGERAFPTGSPPRVCVVVMGDLGRSPRMLYHALELADAGAAVDLVGYAGRPLPRRVNEHSGIRCHRLRDSDPAWRHGLPRPLFAIHAAFRLTVLGARLLRLLLNDVSRPEYLLVQTPPAVPSLMVALAVSRLRRAPLVIDWHNFGFTVLAARLGQGFWLVRAARRLELSLARRAHGHFCVSTAMQQVLSKDWALPDVRRLYDLPRVHPGRLSAEERRTFLSRLSREMTVITGEPPLCRPEWRAPTPFDGRNTLTDGERENDGQEGREASEVAAALMVSATSWSSDEDFGLLLRALPVCDALFVKQARANGKDPSLRLMIVVTGDGPGRATFETKARSLSLTTIRIATAWLSAEDYPRLLAAADIGLCLHRSTSGLDLPIKLVDMLGAGLPVCALDYGGALGERLRHGENAVLFHGADSLGEAVYELLCDFPGRSAQLGSLRQHVRRSPLPTWREEWRRVAYPLFFAGAGDAVRHSESPLR